ncbi:MAG TPA: CBS domain-containing protein [Syntrophales bacterium]|jgi:CBS domain-containing protein|nr:CBS domain-containing protein [Syntrophales bacterium]HOU78372.1 CBS domain-containing protein [Syntrophales bacterium]HPC33174.1 CBS domain-containing protein [Syntrophales bacterium]HQG34541.1 CBS domain-containing protein [Syntrophales bacterium]HQI36058.1 CBS domain-containing protein [Syntrophales bacterium]
MAVQTEPQVFLFLSEILGKSITGPEGRPLGKIVDLVATLAEPYPIVTEAMILPESGVRQPRMLRVPAVEEARPGFATASWDESDSRQPILRDNELFLKEALLDKQIVDTYGAKVRRVNDLQFLKARRSLHLVHVDVGFRGLMRRTGLEKAMDVFLRGFFDYTLPNQYISWKYVQPIASPDLLRLKIAQDRLSQLHPADLADIIEDLDIRQRSAVFQSLDVETAAETLEETDPKIQVSLIEDMDAAEASDIIEEMSLSEAADLLGDLSREKAEVILKEMEQEIAEDVKELLAHPEEEAGGLMTTAIIQLPPAWTVEEALAKIRAEAEDMDFIYYIYVIDEEERLLGMLSLKELLTAPAGTRLGDIMDQRVVSVSLDEDKDEIAEQFAKYGLLAIPVVNGEERIKGVIPFKNLLEIVAPHLGKK